MFFFLDKTEKFCFSFCIWNVAFSDWRYPPSHYIFFSSFGYPHFSCHRSLVIASKKICDAQEYWCFGQFFLLFILIMETCQFPLLLFSTCSRFHPVIFFLSFFLSLSFFHFLCLFIHSFSLIQNFYKLSFSTIFLLFSLFHTFYFSLFIHSFLFLPPNLFSMSAIDQVVLIHLTPSPFQRIPAEFPSARMRFHAPTTVWPAG